MISNMTTGNYFAIAAQAGRLTALSDAEGILPILKERQHRKQSKVQMLTASLEAPSTRVQCVFVSPLAD